jgi:predicted amidophosphoribosyltransferase
LELSRKVVHAIKYSNDKRAAFMMGELMAMRFGRPAADFLVPVPLHKLSDREYNQSEIIARGAGKIWKMRTAPVLKWRFVVPSQALKSGTETRTLPGGAMVTVMPVVHGRAFIIDDVYTSGSTIAAAAAALEKAGAFVAGAMVWSRTEVARGDRTV